MELEALAYSEIGALQRLIRAQGNRPVVLDVHPSSTDASLLRGSLMYGRIADDPARRRSRMGREFAAFGVEDLKARFPRAGSRVM